MQPNTKGFLSSQFFETIFLLFFFNVDGVHIRVSEQDFHCLFRSIRPLCALNDSLEKLTHLSSRLTPFGWL